MFTARFGPGPGPVRFDRICTEQGIRHLLTAPRSPTTTGKVERWHKTMRREFFDRGLFTTLAEAQAALDAWVVHYNTMRPHQGIGDRPPADRFALAQASAALEADEQPAVEPEPVITAGGQAGLPVIQRWVAVSGRISLAGHRYLAGRWLAGELVQITLSDGLVQIAHRGVLVATHARRRTTKPGRSAPLRPAPAARPPRPATSGLAVTRIADGSGTVPFAGTGYHAGWAHRRKQVQVALVGDTVQLAVNGQVVRVHPARHDRAKEHGAFATPKGRPRKPKPA